MLRKLNIYAREWCDIVFEGRNKKYGAYELRKNSNKLLIRSFIIVTGSVSLVFVVPSLVISPSRKEKIDVETIISKIKIEDTPIPDMPKTPVTAEDFPQNPLDNTGKDKKFDTEGGVKITPDGAQTSVGSAEENAAKADSAKQEELEPLEKLKEAEEEVIENTPDEMAQFNNNSNDPFADFRAFIAKNLKYPEDASRMGIQGTVYVQFVIEKDGSMTHITIPRGIMPIIDTEVIRVVKIAPKWTPAKKKGKPVRVSYTIPIVFQIN